MTGDRRSIVYCRVSTTQQTESGLGIDAQRQRCEAYAVAMNYLPTQTVIDHAVSGMVSPDERPAMSAALADLDAGRADVLIVASLSRLGRSTTDVLDLAARAEAHNWALAILDLSIDTTTPTGRFALTVLAAVSQLERDQTAERTKAALHALKARGVRLGRAPSDASRAAGEYALRMRDIGLTWREITAGLEETGHRTAQGHAVWSVTQARRAAETVRLDVAADEAAAAHAEALLHQAAQ